MIGLGSCRQRSGRAMSAEDNVKHVTEAEYNRISKELDRARELTEADTSKMTLAEKIEHKRAIKRLMDSARGR